MRSLVAFVLLAVASPLAAQTPLWVTLTPPVEMDDALRSAWSVTFDNFREEPVEEYRFTISSAPARLLDLPDECVRRFRHTADCTISVAGRSSRELTFTTRSGARFGHVGVTIAPEGEEAPFFDEAVFGREFPVTSTADSGPGTLRQALVDINRECTDPLVPCIARFRVDGPVPGEGWFTVALHSALPEITAPDVFVDGAAQTRHTGETAPIDGPEVLIDGSAAGAGHGLVFRNHRARVAGLSIGGFSGSGIETHAAFSMIAGNYLGVDPPHTSLPNGLDGVTFSGGGGYLIENYLGANLRNGASLVTSEEVTVYGNWVVSNRGQGLFFDKPHPSPHAPVARDNVFSGNVGAAIGLSGTATGNFARNPYRRAPGGFIDVNLDGPSTATVRGVPGRGGVVGAPVITSARVENGVTTITGHTAPSTGAVNAFERVVIFYGSRNVYQIQAAVLDVEGGAFAVTLGEDLRFVEVRAVTYTKLIYDFEHAVIATSEMSEPRRVE